jgi:hypothetical protein
MTHLLNYDPAKAHKLTHPRPFSSKALYLILTVILVYYTIPSLPGKG